MHPSHEYMRGTLMVITINTDMTLFYLICIVFTPHIKSQHIGVGSPVHYVEFMGCCQSVYTTRMYHKKTSEICIQFKQKSNNMLHINVDPCR